MAVLEHRAEVRARHHAAVLADRYHGADAGAAVPSQKPCTVSQASRVPPAETDGMPGFSFPPSASGDTYMVTHDHPLTIAAPGVLGNDTNPIGGTMTAAVVAGGGPSHAASFTLNSDGSFTYTPTSHFFGSDSFQYTASNSDGASGPATVNIAVLDFAPTSADKLYIDSENQILTISVPGLRDGTSDPENDPTTLAVVTPPAHGSLVDASGNPDTIHQDGSFHYQPNLDFVGTDTFTYWANDGVLNGRLATVTITVNAPSVQTVAWVGHSVSPLTGNPGSGGGLAIFPDNNRIDNFTVDTTTDRSLVDFSATLSPAIPNIKVFFEVIDVDDPSANDVSAPNNDPMGIVDNEHNSTDNRGDGARTGPGSSMYYIVRSNSVGQAIVTNFRVSMQPGDNYRFVASLNPIGSSDYTAIQDDGSAAGVLNNTLSPPARMGVNATGPAVLSDMLTVWRRLHIEDDTMGPVAGNTVTGTMTVMAGNPQSLATLTPDQTLTDSTNRFENGTLTDSAGRSFSVVYSTAADPSGHFDVRVISGTGLAPAQGRFTLVDDDSLRDGQALPRADKSTVAAAMAAAYVSPIFGDVGTFDANVPFVLNVGTNQTATIVTPWWQSRTLNTSNFWTAYVLEGFQGDIRSDYDPNIEGGIEGTTSSDGGSIIYHETNLDAAAANGRNAAIEEQDTVVHELGHAVGNAPEPVTRIPSGPSQYTLESIAGIRQSPKPKS